MSRLAAILVAVFVLMFSPAVARDLGQWSGMSADRRACFKSLNDRAGQSCCDNADGSRVEDADWREDPEGGHSVLIDGAWQKVPDAADLTGVARPCVGYPMVWRWNGRIRCFIPGASG